MTEPADTSYLMLLLFPANNTTATYFGHAVFVILYKLLAAFSLPPNNRTLKNEMEILKAVVSGSQ